MQRCNSALRSSVLFVSAIAVVIIALVSFAPPAEASAHFTIHDEASCEGAPFGGTWDGVARSCTVNGFNINSDGVMVNPGITLVNTGTMNGDINNFGIINNTAAGTINGYLANSNLVINDGTINSVLIGNSEGTIDNKGTISIPANGIFDNEDEGTIKNYGTLNNFFSEIYHSGTINNYGTLNNNGNIVMGIGTINNSGTIDNKFKDLLGTIIMFGDGGFLNNNGTMNHSVIKNAGGIINVQCGGIFTEMVSTEDALVDACAPVAASQSISTNKDNSVTFTLNGTNPDIYPDFAALPLQFSVASGPSNGTLVGSNSSWTYTAASNFSGSDSFTFVANDGTNNSTAATISITVNALDDTLIANGQAVATDKELAIILSLAEAGSSYTSLQAA